jgi:hypothetical protein
MPQSSDTSQNIGSSPLFPIDPPMDGARKKHWQDYFTRIAPSLTPEGREQVRSTLINRGLLPSETP